MQPSWTFPIPQAMQQHRGSREHKAAQLKSAETVTAQARTAVPTVSSRASEAVCAADGGPTPA
jgi:hypothetical protein